MIPLSQIRDLVVRPALQAINAWTPAAEILVIGTGLQESGYAALAQDGGPALGFWLMEPATATDIWDNYLAYQNPLSLRITALVAEEQDKIAQLTWNLQYGAAMCRIKYLRAPDPLPAAADLEGMAAIYKKIYNSPQGAATPAEFINKATAYGLMNLNT